MTTEPQIHLPKQALSSLPPTSNPSKSNWHGPPPNRPRASKGIYPSSPDSDDDIIDILSKNDIQVKDTRLLQALLSTRHQLSRVKELVKDQTQTASERIAEMERQRDEALSDAAYARARLAAAQSGDPSDVQSDRAAELGRKLVTALSLQTNCL